MLIWETSRGDHSKPFLRFEFFCESPPSCFKAHKILETPQVLRLFLGLGLWTRACQYVVEKELLNFIEKYFFRNRMIVWNTDTLMLGKY